MPAKPSPAALLSAQRHAALMALVSQRGARRVTELAAELGVSVATVRRDLKHLDDQGFLSRVHGGAVATSPRHPEDRSPVPHTSLLEARARIGVTAAARVTDNMTIMIIGGATTSAMVAHLSTRRNLTVITNGLEMAMALSAYQHIQTVVLGGILHHDQLTLTGSLTESNMNEFLVDEMFAGAYGVHPEKGITGNKHLQAGAHRGMLTRTRSLTVLADSSKLGRSGPVLLAETHQLTTLITDTDAPNDVLDNLRSTGVHITLC